MVVFANRGAGSNPPKSVHEQSTGWNLGYHRVSGPPLLEYLHIWLLEKDSCCKEKGIGSHTDWVQTILQRWLETVARNMVRMTKNTGPKSLKSGPPPLTFLQLGGQECCH